MRKKIAKKFLFQSGPVMKRSTIASKTGFFAVLIKVGEAKKVCAILRLRDSILACNRVLPIWTIMTRVFFLFSDSPCSVLLLGI